MRMLTPPKEADDVSVGQQKFFDNYIFWRLKSNIITSLNF